MKPKTQKEAILNWLKKRPITQMMAIHYFACYRLSSIIWKLKRDGHKINTKLIKFKSRFGFKGQYAEYKLIK